MSDFNEFWEDLKKEIISLAEETIIDFKEQAISAGNDFLEQSKDDIKLWTAQLATGEMNQNDFEWLIKSKESTIKLILLKQKGVAKANIDKFTSSLLNGIVSTAFNRFII